MVYHCFSCRSLQVLAGYYAAASSRRCQVSEGLSRCARRLSAGYLLLKGSCRDCPNSGDNSQLRTPDFVYVFNGIIMISTHYVDVRMSGAWTVRRLLIGGHGDACGGRTREDRKSTRTRAFVHQIGLSWYFLYCIIIIILLLLSLLFYSYIII